MIAVQRRSFCKPSLALRLRAVAMACACIFAFGATVGAAEIDPAKIPAEPDTSQLGAHLQRTMALLAASNAGEGRPVRVLFYGQSIVAQGRLQHTIVAELQKQFPKAKIEPVTNAIGGYMAPALVRTMVHDVVYVRPDVIIFDDYGGETDGNYEKIIAYMRSHTCADVLLWSPHVDNFNAAIEKEREATAIFRRDMAQKYGCEFADVRTVWKQYLEQTNTPKTALLRDQIHNTDTGCELMGQIIVRHFVARPDAVLDNAVRIIHFSDPAALKNAGVTITGDSKPSADGKGLEIAPGGTVELPFTGVRVDLDGPAEAPAATAAVKIDGQAPTSLADVWVVSRPSTPPIGWFPAINRVTLETTPKQREDWTLHFYDVSPDGKSYHYKLAGSKTGDDGEGSNGADFKSTSGQISFAAADVTLATAAKDMHKPMPAEFDVKWRTYPLAIDQYSRKPGEAANAQYQTLANGLADQSHRLELTANGPGPLRIDELEIDDPAARGSTGK